MKFRLFAAILFFLLYSLPLSASSMTIGEANGGNCYPFSCGSTGDLTRFQQVYNADAFGTLNPIRINSLSFFAAEGSLGEPSASGVFEIYLATSTTNFGFATADFDANLGSDSTLFAIVSFGPNMPLVFTIMGTTPFFYDPSAGDLVMDVRVLDWTTEVGYSSYFQADNETSMMQRSFLSDNGAEMNYASALVTQFDYANTSPIPEPPAILLTGLGLGAFLLSMYSRRKGKV